jgi:SAM-dependent methyltransferase
MTQTDRLKWNDRYKSGAYGERRYPSALLQQWIDRIPCGRALDVACGAGRNALFLAARGFTVDAVDISRAALDLAHSRAQDAGLHINWIEQDLDEPLALDAQYALIVVMRYVNLPLLRQLTGNLAPGGFLVCEQHLVTDEEVVGPSDSAYRVASGALRAVAKDLRIHHLEEAIVQDPDKRKAALARLVAQKP